MQQYQDQESVFRQRATSAFLGIFRSALDLGLGVAEKVMPQTLHTLKNKASSLNVYFEEQWDKADKISSQIVDTVNQRFKAINSKIEFGRHLVQQVVQPAREGLISFKAMPGQIIRGEVNQLATSIQENSLIPKMLKSEKAIDIVKQVTVNLTITKELSMYIFEGTVFKFKQISLGVADFGDYIYVKATGLKQVPDFLKENLNKIKQKALEVYQKKQQLFTMVIKKVDVTQLRQQIGEMYQQSRAVNSSRKVIDELREKYKERRRELLNPCMLKLQ